MVLSCVCLAPFSPSYFLPLCIPSDVITHSFTQLHAHTYIYCTHTSRSTCWPRINSTDILEKAEGFPWSKGESEALLRGRFGLNGALTSVGGKGGLSSCKLRSRGLNRGPFASPRFALAVKLIPFVTPSGAHRFALDKYCYQCIMQWSVKTRGSWTL